MRGRSFLAATAITVLIGTVAVACPIEQSGVAERLDALQPERGELTPEASAALARMHGAAAELDRLGFSVQCEEVLDTALSLVEREDAWRVPVAGDAIEATVGTLNLSTLSAQDSRATALIGQPLVTTGGADAGVIEDVLFDSAGTATHVLARRGGWSDEGARLAVPATRLLSDGTGRVYVEIAPDALSDAPHWGGAETDLAVNDGWYAEQAGRVVQLRAMEARKARTAERARAEITMQGEPDSPAPDAAPPDVANTADPGPLVVDRADTALADGPKRVRVERDRPESAEGSSD